MLAQRRRQWPIITSALGQCIVLPCEIWDGKRHPHSHRHAASQKTRCNHPMLFQCRASVADCGSTLKQHWVNTTCLRKVYRRPSDGLVLGQRRRRLTGIDPAMGCDASPTLNRDLVGKAYILCMRYILGKY